MRKYVVDGETFYATMDAASVRAVVVIGDHLSELAIRGLFAIKAPAKGEPKASPGTPPDVRFMSRNFLRRGQQAMWHGIEVVAEYLGSDE